MTSLDSERPRPARFIYSGFSVERGSGELRLRYAFEGGPAFTETISFGRPLPPLLEEDERAFLRAVGMLYALSGISYYKLYACEFADLNGLPFAAEELALLEQIFAGGLAEFAYRNGLDLSERPRFVGHGPAAGAVAAGTPSGLDAGQSAVLIGGGKDSLVSIEAMRASDSDFRLLAVNPRTPMIECARLADRPLIAVGRQLDPLLFEFNDRPDTYNGHVPITAIVSMIAVVGAFFHGYANIVLSNERSADEPTLTSGGQAVNHQYSKTSDFEDRIADYIRRFISPAISYFSLLRPLSELHIAALFGRTDRYDHAFTSCNRAFRLRDRPDALWCGDCAKCRFTFLLLALSLPKERLLSIFPANLLDDPGQIAGYRELCGLAAHKPWDCVGEELESALALAMLARRDEWRHAAVVETLASELGEPVASLERSFEDFMTPRAGGMLPPRFRAIIDAYAS